MGPMATKYAAAILLSLQAILLAWGAVCHSPTYDEVAHLPAGLSHWERGDYHLYRVNPPLVRMIASLPVWFLGADTDWSRLDSVIDSDTNKRIDFEVGAEFIAANGPRAFWLYTFARWACILFATIGGWAVWRWSRKLYGDGSAILAVALWTFSPMVIGHGQLITPDVAAASMGTLAFYLFWQWLREPLWRHAYLVGAALGLAELTKTTWVIAIPLMLTLWLGFTGIHCQQRWRQASQLAFIFGLAWFVFVLGYSGDGLFKPLGEYQFQSQAFSETEPVDQDEEVHDVRSKNNRFAGTWMAGIPVPLPEQYVLGVDVQKANFESTTLSYLGGELRSQGWWYYYLYAVGVKSTCGALLLLVGVTIVRIVTIAFPIANPNHRNVLTKDEWIVVVPLIAILVTVSSQTGINKHLRYLLPAHPFAIIWISQAVRLAGAARPKLRKYGHTAMVACTAWAVSSSLWIYPHSMSYFNELAGGPRRGDQHLINSNIDWGQDLFYLRDELDKRGWRDVGMVYWGRFDPRLAGIEFDLPPRGPFEATSDARGRSRLLPKPGRYAISVNHIRGYAFLAPDGNGGLAMPRKDAYSYFQRWQPIATAGYSTRLYEISTTDVTELRQRLGFDNLPDLKIAINNNLSLDNSHATTVTAIANESAFLLGCADGSVKRFQLAEPMHQRQSATDGEANRQGVKLMPASTHSVAALASSPSGDRFVSGYANGDVFLATTETAREASSRIRLGTHDSRITAVAFSPDGTQVASASNDGIVQIWDTNGSGLSASIDCELTTTALGWVTSNQLLVGTGDWKTGRRGSIGRYDVTGQWLGDLENSRHLIIDLVATEDGRVIGRNHTGELSIWDGITGKKQFTLVGETSRQLSLSSDERWLAASVATGTIRIWELSTGDLVQQSKLLEHRIEEMAFVGTEPVLIAVDARGNAHEISITLDETRPTQID